MNDALSQLSEAIRVGLPGPSEGCKALIEGLFGERYHQRHFRTTFMRDAYALAGDGGGKVPYAGLINPENPPSGPYGGTSVVWFPTDAGSLIVFVVGTRGLSPDEGILMRPGHRRRIASLRRHPSREGVTTWTKPDPAALGVKVPKSVSDKFPDFAAAFKRYGSEVYAAAKVPEDPDDARQVVRAFLDLYAFERGWQPMAAARAEYEQLQSKLREDLFPAVDEGSLYKLLRERRFVVLEGPPGTGKTRLAEKIRRNRFDRSGMTVQFHPAVTYEDFMIGLSPDASSDDLRFDTRPGVLLQASALAEERPALLIIDEVNRADLGKVLGEAIYLFEPDAVGGEQARSVQLSHAWNGNSSFQLPESLYVLATMNTADRSIASMDLAVRRRFAFVTMYPDRKVVEAHAPAVALEIFDQVADIFVEHAPLDALSLMPGHAYYLAGSERELDNRLRFELIPLFDEYLRQGLLGAASTELHAIRDSLADRVA